MIIHKSFQSHTLLASQSIGEGGNFSAIPQRHIYLNLIFSTRQLYCLKKSRNPHYGTKHRPKWPLCHVLDD